MEDIKCDNCDCEVDVNNLSRLQVLTDLVEFANQQLKKGSNYTVGWANLPKWNEDIDDLRASLPNCVVEEFDEQRRRDRHRENCGCMLCVEQRTSE